MAEPPSPKNMLVSVILVGILLFALMVFSPLGALIGVFSPFPLVFIYLQRGRQVGIILVVLVFGMLLMMVGVNQAMLFLAEYALMALLLGEMIRIQLPGDRCITISALASGLALILLLNTMRNNTNSSNYSNSSNSSVPSFAPEIGNIKHQS